MARQSNEESLPSNSASGGNNNSNLPQRPTLFTDGLLTPTSMSSLPSPRLPLRSRPSAPESLNSQAPPNSNKRAAGDNNSGTENHRSNTSGKSIIKPPSPPHVVHRSRHRQPLAPWDLNPPATALFPGTPARKGQPFNTFKALLRHPNLFFQFALRLPPSTYVALFAIDKEFHYRANKYSISLIYDFAKYHAPEAAWIFSWMLYPDLCISDPLLKPMDDRPHLARDIPGLRWVIMILSRERVVREILTLLATEGHRVPARTKSVLMKFWVVMERKTQGIRESFLNDPEIWSDEDILLFHLFLVKLDMRIGCPVQGYGCGALSWLLLTQKSLIRLRDILFGRSLGLGEDLEDVVLRTYLQDDLDTHTFPWLANPDQVDVSRRQFGELSHEHWDGTCDKTMDSAVDIVITEGLKRGLDLEFWLADFVTAGWVDDAGNGIPKPRKYVRKQEVRSQKKTVPTGGDVDDMQEFLDQDWECAGISRRPIAVPQYDG